MKKDLTCRGKLQMKKILVAFLAFSCIHFSVAQVPDTLDLMIGQMIMVGLGDFNEPDESQPVFDALRSGKAGGVILFEKNIHPENSSEKLQQILVDVQEQSLIPAFVSIDEEGGRVSRLKTKYGFPKTVTAQYLGQLNNLDSTRFYANQTAAALYKLGVNMNFAPSVDVNINPENPVIGSMGRSFSGDYKSVIAQAETVIDTHDLYGIITVLKHFPGHGSSENDTHLGLADVTTTWDFEELYPYKALIDSGKARAIMTAHIVNATLDKQKLPSTLSEQVINGILRTFLGYEGVVVSDDMQMQAISAEYGLEEAIKRSILAGVDILLFANNVPDHGLVTAHQIHKIIRNLVENGDISKLRIKQSYDRIIDLKTSIGLPSP